MTDSVDTAARDSGEYCNAGFAHTIPAGFDDHCHGVELTLSLHRSAACLAVAAHLARAKNAAIGAVGKVAKRLIYQWLIHADQVLNLTIPYQSVASLAWLVLQQSLPHRSAVAHYEPYFQ